MSKRTHTCGELRKEDEGKSVVLCGWIDSIRDHGGVIFISLRDRYGITQILVKDENLRECARKLGLEYVIEVRGTVAKRPKGMANPNLKTGEIDVISREINLLSPSKVPPFVIQDNVKASDELRLKFRYLDLRRSPMLKAIDARSKMLYSVRSWLEKYNFLEVGTPSLTKSTPEGARDFLVPSRIYKGKFYCLAQSPQLYKQLLMIAGIDRYFQFARCFRDEDQRKDRQPEHIQIDMELSFTSEDEIFKLTEGMMKRVFKDLMSITLRTPFERITYKEAMERYGTDKPDTRYDYFIQDIKEIASHSDFRPFKESEAVKSIPFGENLSRKELDRLSKFAEDYYNTKISWLRFGKSQVSGSVKKFFSPELLKALREKTGEGTLLICAGKWKVTLKTLGALRLEIIKRLKPPSKQFQFLWVTEFPLFEWDDKINGWVPCHHLFTMPKNPEMITVDPGKVISRQYDLVLNGVEVGSGSIRIHNRELQEKVMKIVGLDKERRDKDFGFFLNALEYGAPPHGGIALGIDRILMVMLSRKSIQDVIPFPKTLTGMGPLEGVPSEVDEASLREVGIKVRSKQ